MRADRRWVAVVVAALAPWAWFAVRNLSYAFDLVATGLPVLCGLAAAGLGLYAALRRRPLLVVGVVSWLLVGILAVVGPWREQAVPPPVRGFRIVSANVNSRNPTVERAVADALAQQGDLVLLIEAGKGKFETPAEYS